MIEHFYEKIHGWFEPHDKLIYDKAVDTYKDGDIFVEIGSFKGRSSSAMAVNIANSNKKIKFYCIDTWNGSIEHAKGEWAQDNDVINGTLYQTFLNNIEQVKEYITPIRKSSLEAVKDFQDKSLSFVYIDASHEYNDIMNDLQAWYPKVKLGGLLAGHDACWESVISAVQDFCSCKNLIYKTDKNTWHIAENFHQIFT